MDWPIDFPESQPDLLAAARVSVVNDGLDLGRVLAGAIAARDRVTIAYISGIAYQHEKLSPLGAVAEAALNCLDGSHRRAAIEDQREPMLFGYPPEYWLGLQEALYSILDWTDSPASRTAREALRGER